MILLTGATGFTGRHVLGELLRRNKRVRCFVRESSSRSVFEGYECEVFEGDIGNAGDWEGALAGVEGIINLVSFKEGHIGTLIAAAEKAGVNRAVFVSTTAIFTSLNATSKEMRTGTEAMIAGSRLNWCILRPTMIYGAAGDRNISRLMRAVKRFPIHPVLGSGTKLIQPIFVEDLAKAIVDAYSCWAASCKAYNLAGAAPLSYRECVATIASLLGKKTVLVSMPLPVAIFAVKVCSILPFLPKIKVEQVLRLNEDKAFDYSEAARDFGFHPISFRDGAAREIRSLWG